LRLRVLLVAFAVLWLIPDLVALLDREPDVVWQRVRETKVIRFATEASYHPFEAVGSQGEFFGLDIDIANEVAQRIGVRAEFTFVGIDGLYDVLRVGQADASISALPIDAARLSDWVYSQPYFDAGLVLIVDDDSTLTHAEDLPGHVTGVVLGSISDARLRYYQRRMAGIEAVYFDSDVEALEAVSQGRADAAILDGIIARQLLTHMDGLRIAATLTHEPFAIALWGESVKLKEVIDQALGDMQADGTIDRIVEEWMRR
jgi:ABC-type amino acid transport substrate-binding protein